MNLKPGDRVQKNPATWQLAPEFDQWGRGKGIGRVVDVISDTYVDVRWPNGRCYERIDGLELVTDD